LLVLLDTSILIRLAERPSLFLEELSSKLGKVDLAIPTPVLKELVQLSLARDSTGRAAKLALAYAESLANVECEGAADDALLLLAQSKGAVVATLDLDLIRRLRRLHVPVATLQGERLELRGPFV
jgi:rRNA-processing protein FCF1